MDLAFFLTSLAIVATPGTGVVLTIAAGLRGGRRPATITALGCTLGIVPHLVAAITGTAALLRASGTAFEMLKIAGIAYLLWMAWATWRDRGEIAVDGQVAPTSARRLVVTAVLANLLNPSFTLFFFAFLPQFVTPGRGELTQMLALSGVFMALTLIVFIGYGWCAALMREHVITRPAVVRRVQRVFAAGYLVLAARLATVERA